MEQTAPERVREQLLASRRAASKRLSPEQQRRVALLAVAGLVALLVALLFVARGYAGRYEGRVYRGVAVAGVPLGGLGRDDAIARLDERAAAWAAAPVTARAKQGDGSWDVAPADLGTAFDTAAAADAALAVGRGGNPFGNFGGWFGALLPAGGRDLALPATLDDARLDDALRSWAGDATFGPKDATFKVAADDMLIIVADVDGLGFDFDGSRRAFLAAAARLDPAPVTLAQVPVPAPITAAMLRAVEPQARAVAAQPLVARYYEQSWTLDAATLASAVAYRLEGDRLVLALDPAPLRPLFAEIGRGVNKPGANAKLVTDATGRYVVAPSTTGFGLDESASLAQINAALAGGAHESPLTIRSLPPPIVEADLEPIRARLEKLLATPVIVTFEEYKRILVRPDLQPLVRLTEQPDRPEKVAIALDGAGIRALTQVIADEVNQPVREARFEFVNRAIRDVEKSQDGRLVDFAATENALRAAILGATGKATPAVTVTRPKVASSARQTMLTPDVLGTGRTAYGGIAARIHNLELAAERLNGAIIPPGEKFSFNAQVGEQTIDNGYQEAYGIALVGGAGGKPGEVKTVSSVAGGICQVSTTLIQAVFPAGLPIEERNWHLFWLSYANSSTGLQGLDATVDDQSGLDFQFWNTTGGWIGIEAIADGDVLTITLFGKNPGWKVIVADPVITNVRVPDPEPAYDKTHDLPPGTRRQIESASQGFDASIRRRVYDRGGNLVTFNGQPMDTAFRSNYLPSRNRYQVGVPKAEPLDTPYVPGRSDD